MGANESGLYSPPAMSDEERVAILADIILEAINSEQAQGAATEG